MNDKITTDQLRDLLRGRPDLIEGLGDRLYSNILTSTLSKRGENRYNITRDGCNAYFEKLSAEDTRVCFPHKSVIYDGLAKFFPDVRFEESPAELDHAGDVDYLGYVGERAFGIQIKPTTAKANFGNYSVSERMRNSFAAFQEDFSGKVFMVFSLDGEIGNPDIIPEISAEIERLLAM